MPDDARPAGGPPAPAEHEQLTRLGKYEIERKLGSGGMGTVFLAKDSDLKRTVALKVLAKDRAENPVLVRRFKAEGQAAAYLQHKNIVGVYDSGQIDGFLYIALEFVEGQDVLEIIRKRGVIPVKRSIEIVRQVAEALEHAYEKQIVHRDIKPSNLLIKNDGTVKLADLGLARSIDETLDTSITRVGTTVGTVDYMSPEQARNSKATDIRSDIYSLGCTWYHILTGVPPYGEGSVTNKLQAHATAPLPDPRSRNERIPEGVVAVLHRMMAKQAKDRYQTPAELLEDLKNPGIARSGLNADILAALAQPGGSADQESSSGDIFETRSPFDSTDLDSAINTLRQDALPTGVVFDDENPVVEQVEDETSDESKAPTRSKIKPGPQKEPPRGKAPPREERVEEPDDRRPLPPRTPRGKAAGSDPGKSGPLPRRQSKAEREAVENLSDSAKHRFQKRKLPPRAETAAQAEPVQVSVDSDRLRKFVLAGIALAILVGIGVLISRMFGEAPVVDRGQGNAAAALQGDPAQQPAVPQAPTAGAPDENNSQDTPAASGEPNDASTALRKSSTPIAGAEDLADLNSVAAREFLPDWVFQVRKSPVADAKTVVVRRPGTAAVEGVATFAEALSKLPPGPVTIEFHGDGPFLIAPGTLPARPQLLLKGATGSRPVLVFASGDLKSGDACLRSEGPIAFRGLNLVLTTSGETAAGVAMIEASAVSLTDCTLQSVGQGGGGSSLVRVSGASHEGSGAVLENCHLRSELGDGLSLIGPSARVLAGNSLFCFDKGSAISIAPASAAIGVRQGREVTFLRSTVICGTTGVSLTNSATEPPAPVAWTLRKSVMNGASHAATLLHLKGWPASEETLTDKPIPVGVSWRSEQSVLQGWDAYARISTGPTAPENLFEGDSGWQKFWRQPPAGTRLIEKGVDVPGDFALADASALASLGSTRDIEPGCKIAALPNALAELIERVRILASARRLPADFIAFRKPAMIVEFNDIKAGTLNALLNDRSKCPDGALVQLRGAGIKTLPAIQIQDRTLHIEFVQADGAPLTIRPQPGLTAGALITIQGGSISFLNGRFLLPESDRQTFPPSLIDVVGADFALTNCTLTGPSEVSTRLGPLIRWTAGGGGTGLLIKDSFLAGGRVSVEADMTGRMLEIDNSVLAAVDDSIALSIADAARSADLTVASSTLAAGRSIVNLTALPPGEAPVLTAIVNDSLVLGTQAGGKASMLTAPAVESLSRIRWWEDGVGYARNTSTTVRLAGGGEALGDWSKLWGAGHVLRVCISELAVLFEKPLENLSKAEPAMFHLNPGCLAAAWSSTGGPLGATGPAIGASSETQSTPAAEQGASKPPGNLPKRPRSVF
ncbi:Serine/threonine-protein kinase PknB [Caulifigura coniformis]|uniref:non-specific serine/threonine protein kinase n=1 Tax=Caulifigura coniformis TaxID=2527983 RepID=A0A517SL44_9PLAN|nr:serine/threonine-protein kinase [Caulifigura coniformis]QDT56840.1 Serine/threonine-protein kinase PknB [Caulifigura coniformis]